MKFKKYLLGIALTTALTSVYANADASPHIIQVDASKLIATDSAPPALAASGMYIVELKGATAINMATKLGELIPSNQMVVNVGNNYNAKSPKIEAYVAAVKAKQASVAADIGAVKVLHNYAHTFNGFSARLSPTQLKAISRHPDVAAVYPDEVHQLQTTNTPTFLGLVSNAGDGLHDTGIVGEDVIVGILDSGVWPENPSFSAAGTSPENTYGPAPAGWAGECNVGSVGSFVNESGEVVYDDSTAPVDEFTCNNKLIGARYFGSTFSSVYEMQFSLGAFASPRDDDGHGSHTASTAAGNAGVTAVLSGAEVGIASGIAPRARVAAYKVCWNANYEAPTGPERGCFFGDSLAAIDQAVVDGVDVLNYSIGNSQAINTPVYNASLSAANAGVFFAASAGNSGPTAATVSNIAPWIATVAASTYDGISAAVGKELIVNSGELAPEVFFSVPAVIGTALPVGGLTGDLGLADPILACGPLNNDLTGKIALISRGTCPFTDKMANAEAAGAIGVIVYTLSGTPIPMGGTDPGIGIPGVMVFNADGLALADSVNAGSTNVTMSQNGAATDAVEVGNIMASFSSRGVNTQTGDILKPDITAPGVRILAASSPQQLQFGGNPQGENFAYLQGTSMSSPHIAGMAALLAGQYPNWTPAQIKSAIMTTARQNLVKENGTTPADPFDFGAGHVAPAPSLNPGLVYSANLGDYLGFLCGQGEAGLVSSARFGADCTDIVNAGFATDASQLNYPSIAIAELAGTETISRTVTDVTGNGGTYNVVVDAPEGTTVTVATFDAGGNVIPSGLLEVAPNGTASYSLTFNSVPGFPANQWVFGAVTLESSDGLTVRSPIAVNQVPTQTIIVPELLSLTLNRGRALFFVETLYSGSFNIDYQGLSLPFGVNKTSPSNPGAFNFGINVASPSYYTAFGVPEGATLLRISTRDGLVSVPGTNLDLVLYTCVPTPTGNSCSPLQSSTGPDANEDMIIVNPENTVDSGLSFYLLFVQGVDLLGNASVDYTQLIWIVDGAESTTVVSASTRAVENRLQNISLRTRGLASGLYMGTVTFTDGNGEVQGTTALEVVQP
ncbi:S8 family serine peptidase [Arsukibacterium sp. UBA3155]|uniref:S8 family serine peptidase n=1 Tax=Arsukibacterium sp. UBA3155 TaxID=1946058 RepID=UPI0025B92840|nr:S8 family serine peptidase [Arsukibacterium sp. UBA3155]|tara:strand:- start:50286 stop:53504 length:3219 start_codon:yes stop_codon:yes gene_type:complete